MELFVPRSHTKEMIWQPLRPSLIISAFVMSLLVSIATILNALEVESPFSNWSFGDTVFMMGILATILLLLCIINRLGTRTGLSIEGEDLFLVSLAKKTPITPSEVTAIKVAASEMWSPSRRGRPVSVRLKDETGGYLYSIFLLRSYDDAVIQDFSNDLIFEAACGKHIIGYCIYHQAVIDFLTARNPNLLIIPPEGIQPEQQPRKPGPVQGRITRVTPKDKGFH